jgi:hypothetical protein
MFYNYITIRFVKLKTHKTMELEPKEKANELFSTYFRTGHNIEYEVEKAYAKRNSLLCVDEVLDVLDNCDLYENSLMLCVFYQDVKKEIMKI